MGSQQFCLKWNNHQSNLLNVFDQLLQNEAFVDVTLACEGLSLKAHKMVLSACSPYFQTLFLENPCKHPIVILNSVRYSELKAIVDFMYKGEVNVSQEQLSLLLKTAEMLKVKGLAEVTNQTAQSLNANASDPILSVPSVSPPPSQLLSNHNHRRNGSPPPKRKKVRANPSSSAASSPQSNTLTNYNASKNSTDQAMMALDQSNDSHLPLESKICKEENTDQCMMDLPPKLIMEPAAELVDDQSSMSNITSDMPSYDPTKGDTSVPDLSSPPDITSSNIQSIPSTSGLQGANQDEENLPSVYIPLDDPRKNFAVAKCSMNAMINIKVEETATDSSAALQDLSTLETEDWQFDDMNYTNESLPHGTDYLPQDRDHLPHSTDYLPQDTDHLPQDINHLPQDTDHLPQEADHLPQNTDYLPQATTYFPQDTNYTEKEAMPRQCQCQEKKNLRNKMVPLPPLQKRKTGNHWPMLMPLKNNMRCRLKGCKGKSRIKCSKCKVYLCSNNARPCFTIFHQ